MLEQKRRPSRSTSVEILKEVANDHDEVLADPPPAAFLISFGDSQLDFRLACWVACFGGAYRIAGELRAAVSEAFDGAGIEIPFPQQDLHVRSNNRDQPLPDETRQCDNSANDAGGPA